VATRGLMTRRDAADWFGVSLSHFQRHIQPHLRCVYSGRLRLYRLEDLERFADQAACEPGPR